MMAGVIARALESVGQAFRPYNQGARDPEYIGGAFAGTAFVSPSTGRVIYDSETGYAFDRHVSEQAALALPPFGRGVDLIAGAIAGTPLIAERTGPGDDVPTRVRPTPTVLADPWGASTAWHYRYGIARDLVLWGNGTSLIQEMGSNGYPLRVLPLDATQMHYVRDDNGVLWWRYGASELIPWERIVHYSAGERSGFLMGVGAIGQYFGVLRGASVTQRHTERYFASGGLPPAIITADDPDFSQAQADEVKAKYRAIISSGGNSEPLVLPRGLTFTPLVSDAERQQLVAARQWDAKLVAMILGIPPYMLGLDQQGMTYSNAESVDMAYIRDTVSRWANPIEAVSTKWLLPHGTQARFDWSARLRTDTKTAAEVLAIKITSGQMTVDEARAADNRAPLNVSQVPVVTEV